MIVARYWQRLEGGLILLSGSVLAGAWSEAVPWWGLVLLFFVPDLSFLGYLMGPRVGAFAYNLLHVYAFGCAFVTAGLVLSHPLLVTLGALWLGHSGFDRALGYGLKSPEGFDLTHLGRIGADR